MSAVPRRVATSVFRGFSIWTWELDAAAEKLRLIVEQIGQRLDRGVGRARGFLRIGQQHRPFGILRLFEDDAAEERDGVGGTIGVEIEPREREIDGEVAGAVAARDLEGGHRPFRIGREVIPRLPRLALFGERGEHRTENPVGFLVLRIDLERVLRGHQGFRRLVLPRVEAGELGARLGALRIERDRLAERRDGLVDLAAAFEIAAEQEVVGGVLGRRGRGRLREQREAQGERQQGHYQGR
jgi:hypothetical protein